MKRIGCFTKLFCLAGIAGIVIFSNGCASGYISTEPAYAAYNRPPKPSDDHIWIEGDWKWDNQSHRYVHKTGSWSKQKYRQTYIAGYWQPTPRGTFWENGHWQKQENQKIKQHPQ